MMLNISRAMNLTSDPKYEWYINKLIECYTKNKTHSTLHEGEYNEDKPWCPRTFDGFLCWDGTPASTTVTQSCPDHFTGFDPKRNVYKKIHIPTNNDALIAIVNVKTNYLPGLCSRCQDDGTWSTIPETGKAWTNYTTCVDMEDLDFRATVNNIYIAGYSLSVVAMLMSLFIFCYFRSLRCTRIKIHMNLFASFTLTNIMWIIWYPTVVTRPNVVRENKEWCQILHIVTHYFMMTSYSWMFCESLHLHLSLVVVFVKDELAMRWFVLIGWGISLGIIAVYAVVRYFTPGGTDRCWMEFNDAFWIINIPVALTLLASFVFLVNVIRVLLTKLRPAPQRRNSAAAKKAARATCILVPLFGLHYILIPFRPHPDSSGEKTYQVLSALLISLQGVCLATLFCFTNHDVIMAIKNHISRLQRGNEVIAMTGVTGGDSVNTRDNMA